MLNFLQNSFSTAFCVRLKKKMFMILNSINWPNFITKFHLLLEIFGTMYIAIVCFTCFEVVNFEINLTFLIKLFFYMTKNANQKFKYLENQKRFWGEIKIFFCYLLLFFKNFKLSKIASELRVQVFVIISEWEKRNSDGMPNWIIGVSIPT